MGKMIARDIIKRQKVDNERRESRLLNLAATRDAATLQHAAATPPFCCSVAATPRRRDSDRHRGMSAASSHRRRGFDVAPAAAPKEGLHTKQKSEYRFNGGRY